MNKQDLCICVVELSKLHRSMDDLIRFVDNSSINDVTMRISNQLKDADNNVIGALRKVLENIGGDTND